MFDQMEFDTMLGQRSLPMQLVAIIRTTQPSLSLAVSLQAGVHPRRPRIVHGVPHATELPVGLNRVCNVLGAEASAREEDKSLILRRRGRDQAKAGPCPRSRRRP